MGPTASRLASECLGHGNCETTRLTTSPWHGPPKAPAGVKRYTSSLRGQLLLWLFVPLGILWPLGGTVAYFMAKGFANSAYDRFLLDSARALAAQVKAAGPTARLDLPPVAMDILRYDPTDRVYFRVTGRDGKLVAGDQDFPAPPAGLVPDDRPVFYDGRLHGEAVRVAALFLPAGRDPAGGRVLVQMAETLVKRDQLTREILSGMVLPQVFLILLAALFVWQGVGRGLRPLNRVREAIAHRSHRDLSPLAEQNAPEEVRPLLHAINDLMVRLAKALGTQRRFVADAAHQLRTPLAGLKTQTELALRQTDPESVRHALGQLAAGAERTIRLANQLLALARAEPEAVRSDHRQRLDLAELARRVGAEWVPEALKKEIDLGFERPDGTLPIRGDPLLLREALVNLLDNAIRYTPKGGKVTIRVAGRKRPVLTVEDDGPGIPEAERDRVFERFYRVLGNEADGSGLGLAIVREIVLAHGAEIRLAAGPAGRGSAVSVSFPRYGGPAGI